MEKLNALHFVRSYKKVSFYHRFLPKCDKRITGINSKKIKAYVENWNAVKKE